MIRIDPYKLASHGARALSHRTGILRATPAQTQRHGSFTTILNWGNSERRFDCDYINNPEAVAVASDKLRSARRFYDASIPTPPFTTERSEALRWRRDGSGIIARRLLRGSGGRGVLYYGPDCGGENPERGEPDTNGNAPVHRGGGGREDSPTDGSGRGQPRERGFIVPAPMYTKYIKKATEYRVHVFDGRVIDIQQKRKRQEVPNDEIDYQIRNAVNGWVYCRDGIDCPDSVRMAAINAVAALGLDFGAVDVGWNTHDDAACVYEVNTAPGLEGSTLDSYYEAIKRRLPLLSGGAYQRRRLTCGP